MAVYQDVFTGRARPVVLPESVLALIDAADRTARRGWPPAADDAGQPPPDARPGSVLARLAVVALLTIPALVVAAFVVAAAAR